MYLCRIDTIPFEKQIPRDNRMFYVSETQNLDKPLEPDETYLELRSHYSNVREVMRASKAARSKSMVPP